MMTDPKESSKLESDLRAKLEEMSERIFKRDLGIAETFWLGGRFWLYGSEVHEHDETLEELKAHMAELFDKPYRVRFRFAKLSVDHHNDMAWLNAPAILEIHHPDRIAELPYRLFVLFQHISGQWHWRVFSGSEPATPPAQQ